MSSRRSRANSGSFPGRGPGGRTHPASPLSSALSSPLSLTLVRDTYQTGDDAHELLRFCDTLHGVPGDEAAEQIIGHLLDRVLPAAYAHRPGQPPPRYDLSAALRALTRIAVCMNEDGTRDLQWWRIPTWPPRVPRAMRALRAVLVVVLFFGLLGVLAGHGHENRLLFGLKVGSVFGVIYGLMFLIAGEDTDDSRYRDPPRRMGRLRLRNVRGSGILPGALLYMLGSWLVYVLGSWLSGGPGKAGALSRPGSRDRSAAGS